MRHTNRGLWKQDTWAPVTPTLTAEEEALLDELVAEIGAQIATVQRADAGATVAAVETYLRAAIGGR